MASRPGMNQRPHIAQLEALMDDVTRATSATLLAAEEARARLEPIAQAVKALDASPEAQLPVVRQYILTAFDALASIRDTASLDIRALALWATAERQQALGITETGVAAIIGGSNSTITRWNAAGPITWEEAEALHNEDLAAEQQKLADRDR